MNIEEQSWVRVIVDGKTQFQGTLTKGTQKTWTAKKQLTLRAGNAGGVSISFNQGEPKVFGLLGDVKEVTFTPDTPDLPQVEVSQNSLAPPAESPLLLPPIDTSSALPYRVVVEVDSESEQSLVRSLVPGAFRIVSNGRELMQVGAFSDRANADEIRRLLNTKGLRATIEQQN